jgi:hypothetical protein
MKKILQKMKIKIIARERETYRRQRVQRIRDISREREEEA